MVEYTPHLVYNFFRWTLKVWYNKGLIIRVKITVAKNSNVVRYLNHHLLKIILKSLKLPLKTIPFGLKTSFSSLSMLTNPPSSPNMISKHHLLKLENAVLIVNLVGNVFETFFTLLFKI